MFVLPSRVIECPAVDDVFSICQNAGVDMCFCYQFNVKCILQLMIPYDYMSKHTNRHMLELPNRRLARFAADFDFFVW